ncbi:MAG: bifunctional precorrin-2 dehydrogenase/sirohydrochlorin ferrochelatase [Candidatus Omnitrophica bacterium]|nr:bifunctional precorrin-2 dehydrogenase/sirohydrochlorin ferrochelatase [Candidatus Omnitrophota bacterium]
MIGYPLFLNVQGRRCLVFGGGEVATRKIMSLLKRGAKVTCVSRDFSKGLRKLVKSYGSNLQLKRVKGNRIALDNVTIVIAATSDKEFNTRVVEACRRKKIWVNAVDDPKLCDFYVPATLERGPLQIAISTGGISPLFAKRLREELEKVIPRSTGSLLERIGNIRGKRLKGKA